MARRQFNPEENRLDYSQMLCPPPGYDLEFAVGMTYSLDMEALLGVPVSLGMFEDYDSSAIQNPSSCWKRFGSAAINLQFSAMQMELRCRKTSALSTPCWKTASFL